MASAEPEELRVERGADHAGVRARLLALLGESWRPWRAYATMHLWIADATGVRPPGLSSRV